MSSEGNPKETSESKDNIQGKAKDALAGEETVTAGIKVWNPLNGPTSPIPDLPDSYFEPTIGELKASYETQVRAREALVNAPLKTREVRERELKAKREKYPTTRIRVKFPDRTQLERAFPSTDKIRSVYAFVRSCLRDDVKPIKELKVSDLKVRDLTLYELQLAPSSVLMLTFLDDSLNNPNLRAPLVESILAQAQDLPLSPTAGDHATRKPDEPGKDIPVVPKPNPSNSKSLPKWLKMGKK